MDGYAQKKGMKSDYKEGCNSIGTHSRTPGHWLDYSCVPFWLVKGTYCYEKYCFVSFRVHLGHWFFNNVPTLYLYF